MKKGELMIEIFGHFVALFCYLLQLNHLNITRGTDIRPFLQIESQFSGELAVNYLVTRYHTYYSYI